MASEKRLIDPKEYCRELYRERDCPGRTQEFMDAIEVAIADLCDMPTVDAVEVVRCKDCRWARPQDHREPTDTPKRMIICQSFMNHHIPAPWGARLAVNPEHFCSYGERKDNERKAD